MENLDYDFEIVNDDTFKTIKKENISKKMDLTPVMFDYVLGDKTSLRYEYIKSIPDKEERISEMETLLVELLPNGLPEEYYNWYARGCLNLAYTRYELKGLKRKYRIQRNKDIQIKKKQDRIDKKNLKIENKNVILKF